MIFVFKTSVKYRKQANFLIRELSHNLQITSCTFDLEDCDKILRIKSDYKISDDVIEILCKHDFFCDELF